MRKFKLLSLLFALVCATSMWAAPTIYSGFTVTASSEGLENHGAANLVDGKFSAGTEGTDWTKWSADKSMKTSSPSGGPGLFWWVDFRSDAPICITGYILTSSDQLGQTPTTWTLDAKLNEGDAWTTIAGVLENSTLGANALTDVSFDLDKPGTYKYFRFLVSMVDDPWVNGMQLSELRFISPTSDGKSISIADGTANADKVTLSATSASEGETITLTPMAGYDITSFKAISLDNEVAEIFSFPNGGESSYNGTNISGWCRNNYSGYGAEIGEIFEVRFTALGENKVVTQIDAPVTYIENSTISKTTTTSGYFSYDGSAIHVTNASAQSVTLAKSVTGENFYCVQPMTVHVATRRELESTKNDATGAYSFTKSGADVIIEATIAPQYAINLSGVEHVSINKAAAAEGSSIVVTPDAGYEITSFAASYAEARYTLTTYDEWDDPMENAENVTFPYDMTVYVPVDYDGVYGVSSISVSGGDGKVSVSDNEFDNITLHVTGPFSGTATINYSYDACMDFDWESMICNEPDWIDTHFSIGCAAGSPEVVNLPATETDGAYSFTMPAGNVTISATVEAIAAPDFAGEGTLANPYQITSAADWNTFATRVSEGNTYSGVYFQLTNDIAISTMVGTDADHAFNGSFDGAGHTITATLSSSDNNCAPFAYTYGATIKNLHTTGIINTSESNAGGVVGRNGTASLTLTNVSSDVTINSTKSGNASHGGLVGYAINATISGCAFTGRLLGENSSRFGGLLGWKSNTPGSSVNINDCLFAPAEVTMSADNSKTFAVIGGATVNCTNCYYTQAFGTDQGKLMRAITAGEGVLVLNTGSATIYNVSGITSYGTGISYDNVLYGGNGDEISLNLSGSDNGYEASTGTLSGTENPYTLTMADADCQINKLAPAPADQEITPNADPDHDGVYYSTFFDSANKYALPAGVEAYVATLDGANLLLSKIAVAGQTIPADNAVILKSSVTPFTLSISDAEAVPVNTINNLQGTDVSIATPDNGYVLAGNDGVEFYHYTASMLNPHKAYVIYSGSNQAPKRMPFIFDQATGVENVQGDNVQSTKVLRDGQLIIIRNGVEYNANGMMVK